MSESTLNIAPTGSKSKIAQSKKEDEENSVEDVKELHALEEDLIIEGVPPEKAAILVRRAVTQAIAKFHSGPLPTVEDFEGYERVCPGASRDILNMAISEQKHSHSIQSLEVKGQLILNGLGIAGGVALVALMLFCTVYLAIHDQREVAIAIA